MIDLEFATFVINDTDPTHCQRMMMKMTRLLPAFVSLLCWVHVCRSDGGGSSNSAGAGLHCLTDHEKDRAKSSGSLSNLDTIYARNHCYKCEWIDVKLTVVMLYHNECNSLRFLTHSWQLLPQRLRDHVRLLIIDDNSQIPACSCVDRHSSGHSNPTVIKETGISIIRVDENRKWNIGGGRNMGAFFTCSEYLFVCDIDALISQTLLKSVLALTQSPLSQHQLHQFNRNVSSSGATKFHPGMMLLTRDAYWQNHGCDEDFVGTCYESE